MLVLLGCNYRSAPVDLRERLAFTEDRIADGLARLLDADGVEEAFILSTCNRVELLVKTSLGAERALEMLKRFLAGEREVSREEIERHTYQILDRDAARHLFRVASGLDSMILGRAADPRSGQERLPDRPGPRSDRTDPRPLAPERFVGGQARPHRVRARSQHRLGRSRRRQAGRADLRRGSPGAGRWCSAPARWPAWSRGTSSHAASNRCRSPAAATTTQWRRRNDSAGRRCTGTMASPCSGRPTSSSAVPALRASSSRGSTWPTPCAVAGAGRCS